MLFHTSITKAAGITKFLSNLITRVGKSKYIIDFFITEILD